MKDSELIARLRESVEIEMRSDLFAASGNLRDATMLMREANKIRAAHFGKLDPNELRERTVVVLMGETRHTYCADPQCPASQPHRQGDGTCLFAQEEERK